MIHTKLIFFAKHKNIFYQNKNYDELASLFAVHLLIFFILQICQSHLVRNLIKKFYIKNFSLKFQEIVIMNIYVII